MKKLLFGFLVVCVVIIAFFIINPQVITFEDGAITAPKKPKLVPEDAFWVGGIDGGNFIIISENSHGDNLFSIQIYNDYTGGIEYSGTLKYSGLARDERLLTNPSLFQGWDGEKLHLTNGEHMAVSPFKVK